MYPDVGHTTSVWLRRTFCTMVGDGSNLCPKRQRLLLESDRGRINSLFENLRRAVTDVLGEGDLDAEKEASPEEDVASAENPADGEMLTAFDPEDALSVAIRRLDEPEKILRLRATTTRSSTGLSNARRRRKPSFHFLWLRLPRIRRMPSRRKKNPSRAPRGHTMRPFRMRSIPPRRLLTQGIIFESQQPICRRRGNTAVATAQL